LKYLIILNEVQQSVGASLQEESHKVEEALTSNKRGQIPKGRETLANPSTYTEHAASISKKPRRCEKNKNKINIENYAVTTTVCK
jgi:hypothetical protein